MVVHLQKFQLSIFKAEATLLLGGSDVSASGEGALPIVLTFPTALKPSPRLGSTLPKGG